MLDVCFFFVAFEVRPAYRSVELRFFGTPADIYRRIWIMKPSLDAGQD